MNIHISKICSGANPFRQRWKTPICHLQYGNTNTYHIVNIVWKILHSQYKCYVLNVDLLHKYKSNNYFIKTSLVVEIKFMCK